MATITLRSDGQTLKIVSDSVAKDKLTAHFIWTSELKNYSSMPWVRRDGCPFAVYVEGVPISLDWTETSAYFDDMSNITFVTGATSSTFMTANLAPDIRFRFSAESGAMWAIYNPCFLDTVPTKISALDHGSSKSEIWLYADLDSYSFLYDTAVEWNFYGLVKRQTYKGEDDGISLTIPDSWFKYLADSGKSRGTGTVTCTIQSGGKDYKRISKSFTLSLSDFSLAPTLDSITLTGKSDKIPSSWGNIIVQGLSTVYATLGYTTKYGAKVEQVILDTYLDAGVIQDLQSYSGGQIFLGVPDSMFNGKITIVDSRGQKASKEWEATVIPYSAPKFTTISSKRCTSSGTANASGTYFLANNKVSFSSVNSKNSVSLTVAYKKTNETSYGTAKTITANTTSVNGSGAISTSDSYDVLYTLKDAFNTVEYHDYISSADMLIHFLKGGKGIAFGKESTTENLFDCGFDANIDGSTTCAALTASEKVTCKKQLKVSGSTECVALTASGAVTANSTLKVSGTTTCAAINGTDITASGTLKGASVTSTGAISGTDITASGELKASGWVDCYSGLTVNGAAYLKGTTYLQGASTVSARMTFSASPMLNNNIYILTKTTGGTECSLIGRSNGNNLWIGDYGYKGTRQVCSNAYIAASNVYKTTSSGSTSLSDRRYKSDFCDIDGASDFIMALKPRKFKFTDGTSGRYHMGFVAQDTEKTMLDTVGDTGLIVKYTTEEGQEVILDDESTYIIGIRYEEIIAPLVATVQKQQEEIDELKKRLDALEQALERR